MADFIDSEAEESEDEEELEPHERKRLKKTRNVSDSEEEEDDDEDRLREELKDLIDDNPIEEEEDSDNDDSDGSRGGEHSKRKKSDDEDELDDRLEDEDYELIEENLGVKVERKRFKRLKKMMNEDGSDEESEEESHNRDTIANQLFDGGSDDEEHTSEYHDSNRNQQQLRERDRESMSNAREAYEDDEERESDEDDFIVDDDGVPISDKRKKRRHIFTDASLQEGQDIFGVDFDYDEFEKYDDEYEEEGDSEEAEDEYEEEQVDEGGEERVSRRTKKVARKKPAKKSIYEIYEPSELKRGHFTDFDQDIRKTDMPERMQLRDVPLTPVPEGSIELEEEAEWIYRQAFCRPPVSNQGTTVRKSPSNVPKIKQALDFMRNQHLEVPFIAFYRKEYVQPDLNINDLWKIYKYDAQWCQLRARKLNLLRLFEDMRNFQLDRLMEVPDAPIPEDMRIIRDEDLDRLRSVQTPEELKDAHCHFLLYYAQDINAMHAKRKAKKLQEASGDSQATEETGTNAEQVKLNIDSGPYSLCRKRGLCGLTKRFGLTPEQFAENARDGYQRHEVEQEPKDPTDVAREYVKPGGFTQPEEVIQAGVFMVARQIAREPLFRKSVRELFFERARLSVRPTKRGIKEIDENHPCYSMKYLRNKPIRDFTGDQYLKLQMAKDEQLLTIEISEKIAGSSSDDWLEELRALYHRDEFAKNVQEWNRLRSECVGIALNRMVIPDLKRELQSLLLSESKESVLKLCCRKLYNWIKVAPYQPSFSGEYDDWEVGRNGLCRVMGVAYVPDLSQAAFGAIASPEGEITDYLRIPNLLKRKNAYREDEKTLKEKDLALIRNFIRAKKPHVIAIGGESKDALMVRQDFMDCIKTLTEEEEHFPEISVEIIDNELAKVYSNSIKGAADFREYPPLLLQAISLARRMQDPLVEFSQLCNADEEILCLRYHALQEQISREELLENINLEFINRTNEVGVDVNAAVQNPTTANLVQFVCGLGSRKGQALIKVLKQTNQRLENRTQLVTACHMGPKVFINCSGFIKIDTNSLGDSTEAYVEVLDGSRVHPETYEWARKMAVDALEYDDEEDANPAGALEEILETPERLKDLDLDAFAIELERQGFGNKSITLYDIRAELNARYRDLRSAFRPVTPEELFDYLTKETPESLRVGKLMLATVAGIAHRKPQGDQLDQANPVRNEDTGFWQCPFCMKSEFPELSEVWNHFDAGQCPGQATGVRLRFDNGLTGFIHVKNLSDKHVRNPEERVQAGQTIHVRVIKIDIERFSLECSSKSSDLADRNGEWRPRKDQCYDQENEESDSRKEADNKKQQQRQQYVKRVIVHPSFHNISYTESLRMMAGLDQGEVIVRPSSKGTDHLTTTWKVADNVYQHIDIREEGKENVFSLGQSLWIGNDEFEDLDEIIARHISPMAAYARELLSYKYYQDTEGGSKERAEELLKVEKTKNPNKIHYLLSVAKAYPGKFLLSYLPRTKFRHEYVTITPEGFRFRHQTFDSVNSLLKWFKEHFRDPIPPPPIESTPKMSIGSASVTRTPNYSVATTPKLKEINNETIESLAKSIPQQMLNSLSQATHTPHYSYTPLEYGSSNYVTTPYTPSGQTPYMTPYQQTPHFSQTPRYSSSSTPSQYSGRSSYAPANSRAQYHQPHHQYSHRGDSGQPSPYSNSGSDYGQFQHPSRSRVPPEYAGSGGWDKARHTGGDPYGGARPPSATFSKGGYKTSNSATGRNESVPPNGTPYGGGKGTKFHGNAGGSSNNGGNSGNAPPGNATSNSNNNSTNNSNNRGSSPQTVASVTLGDATPLWDE